MFKVLGNMFVYNMCDKSLYWTFILTHCKKCMQKLDYIVIITFIDILSLISKNSFQWEVKTIFPIENILRHKMNAREN